MHMFICCLLFAVSIALVVKGGDIFVDAASAIAKALKIPAFIIGATIVSLATTLPEMIVSVLAAAEGKTEMAVGNAVGSVTDNTYLILAVAMTAMTIICSLKTHLKQML
ncbi:MAG: sodium:calcium antiporter, partial [Clostridia bacterium]|nr:sodium:calcium antiporter [Clostridia bacterium]